MTLDELNQVNVNDPAAVKALQTFLRSRGYYSGPVDGKWGGGTIEAVKGARGDLQSEAQTKAETARAGAETARTNLQTEQEKSSWGRFGQEFGPYGAGASGGLLAGYGIARGNKAADARLAAEVERMPANKNITPVVAENTLDARLRGRTVRAGKQLLNPAAAFGLAEVTRRYVKPSVSEEIRPYVDLAASAEQGLGGGMAVMTIKDALSSKNPVPADTEALIRSRAAEARGDPHTISGRGKTEAPPAGPDPARMAELRARRAADLKAEAKAMGLHVSGTKEDLARRIAEAGQQQPKGRLPRGKSGILFPLAAGGIAYDAATCDAEASGVDPENARRRGVLAGATAAGAAAAVPYAISKLPEAMGTAARATGPGLVPSTVDAMTDYSPEDLAQGRNTLARYLPSAMRGGAVEDAYQMAQVPERSPARTQLLAAGETGGGDFDTHLQSFIQAIKEHNAGVGEPAEVPFKGADAGASPEAAPLYGFHPRLNPRKANVPRRDIAKDAGNIVEAILSMAPGSGEAMSARDAWNASGRAGDALLSGNYGEAASQYGNMLAGVAGAIPGVGIVARGTKRGAAWMDRNVPSWLNRGLDAITPKDAGRTMFSGAGPTGDADDWRYVRRTQGDNPDTGAGYMMFADSKGDVEEAADHLRIYGKNTWLGKPVKPANAEDLAPDIFEAMQRRGLVDEYPVNGEPGDLGYWQDAIAPKSIVNSAEFWDDPKLVEMAWEDVLEPRGIMSVITPDGMILFDPSGVKPYKP